MVAEEPKELDGFGLVTPNYAYQCLSEGSSSLYGTEPTIA
jgi:hypothetical protein